MEKTCETCGAIGFRELLVQCNKCGISVEHRYCLERIPDQDEYDFTWTCLQCASTITYQSDLRLSEHEPVFRSRYQQKGDVEYARNVKKINQKDGISPSEVQAVFALTSSTHLSCQSRSSEGQIIMGEQLPITSGNNSYRIKTHPSDGNEDWLQVLEESEVVDIGENSLEEGEFVPDLSSDSEDTDPNDGKSQPRSCKSRELSKRRLGRMVLDDDDNLVSEGEMLANGGLQIASTVKEGGIDGNKRRKTKSAQDVCLDLIGETASDKQLQGAPNIDMSTAKAFDPSNGKGNCFEDNNVEIYLVPRTSEISVESSDSSIRKGISVCNASHTSSVHDPSWGYTESVHAQPIFEPIWRGCFQVNNFRSCRLKGHLSSKAGLKASQGAKSLQPCLDMETMKRRDTWPKRFESVAPTEKDVALFFFPEDTRTKKDYGELMDYFNKQDLALKTTVDNGELLVFSSCQLPEPFQRFLGNTYLWGVFKGKQAVLAVNSFDHLRVDAQLSLEVEPNLGVINKSISPRSPLPSEARSHSPTPSSEAEPNLATFNSPKMSSSQEHIPSGSQITWTKTGSRILSTTNSSKKPMPPLDSQLKVEMYSPSLSRTSSNKKLIPPFSSSTAKVGFPSPKHSLEDQLNVDPRRSFNSSKKIVSPCAPLSPAAGVPLPQTISTCNTEKAGDHHRSSYKLQQNISPRAPLSPAAGVPLPQTISTCNIEKAVDHLKGSYKPQQNTNNDRVINNPRVKQDGGQSLSRFASDQSRTSRF